MTPRETLIKCDCVQHGVAALHRQDCKVLDRDRRFTLEELRAADLPRCDWRAFLKVTGEPLSADDERAMDDYFRRFLPPGPCVMCGAQQGGDLFDSILGKARFVWGIVHGVGFCSQEGDGRRCGYPARAYHYDVGPIQKLELILQYHPSELIERIHDTNVPPKGGENIKDQGAIPNHER